MKTKACTLLLGLLVVLCCAHGDGLSASQVRINDPERTPIAYVAPQDRPYADGGPTATAAVYGPDARLSDGRSVSGVMIRSWREGRAARVRVYAVTGPLGTPDTAVEIGSYLLAAGEQAPISEMESWGVKPFVLSHETQQ